MRKCTKCEAFKLPTEFHKGSNKGLTSQCKVCRAAYQKLKYDEDAFSYAKQCNVKKWYGVTLEQYYEAMATSDSCEICGVKEGLCYDHDHTTMAFRGVLCSKCNLGLGKLGDNLESLLKAVKYLSKEAK